MTEFDSYAFADYSGSKYEYQQRKAIALSVIGDYEKQVYTDYIRESLRKFIKSLLVKASSEKKRIIFGFDHSYSFPIGFYDIVAGKKWEAWEQLLDLLCNGGQGLLPVNDRPREWAKTVNDLICKKSDLPKGPFWGPNFKYQENNPKFPFEASNIKEKRLVEERVPQTKPIYKIGGKGSVGLQSLYGIQNLVELRREIKSRILDWFDPNNFRLESENERHRASLEGWIIGVR